jgi:hypothetical protein
MTTRALPPFGARIATVLAVALALGTCAASSSSESRRKIGERYALAFSDAARTRSVTWDDRSCTFTESAPESAPDIAPTAAPAVQMRVIPAARTTTAVRSRTARAGTLDVTFRCDPPSQPCITRMRRDGAGVVGSEVLYEHTMPLTGSIADMARVGAELERLRTACSLPAVDGGA